MQLIMTPERIETVRRIAEIGGTRKDVENALGLSKGATCVLIQHCVEQRVIATPRKQYHQPHKLALPWSEPEIVAAPAVEPEVKDWWDTEPAEEQKKSTGKNWFEGWAGAPALGLGKA